MARTGRFGDFLRNRAAQLEAFRLMFSDLDALRTQAVDMNPVQMFDVQSAIVLDVGTTVMNINITTGGDLLTAATEAVEGYDGTKMETIATAVDILTGVLVAAAAGNHRLDAIVYDTTDDTWKALTGDEVLLAETPETPLVEPGQIYMATVGPVLAGTVSLATLVDSTPAARYNDLRNEPQ